MVAPRPAPVLDVRDLTFAYANGRPILRRVTMSADEGLITMVLGASGSGKTTLLKLVKGLLRPREGYISILGRSVAEMTDGGVLDRRVAYIPQQLGLVRNLSVLDNTLVGALGHVASLPSLLKIFPRVRIDQAYETLDALGIRHKAEEKVFTLSGGERQRVAIARALMQEPRLILADEMVSQLDPVTSQEIMHIIRDIARGGVALVMTMHQMSIVDQYADHVIVLRDGEKVLDQMGRETPVEDLSMVMKS